MLKFYKRLYKISIFFRKAFFSLLISFIFNSLVLAQQNVEFKDISHKQWKGTIKTFDKNGFEFVTTDGITLKFNWDELSEDDARRIKFTLGVTTTLTPQKVVREGPLGNFKGIKLILKRDPGNPLFGIVVQEGTDALNITIQSRGKKFKFSREEISLVEEQVISAKEVFDDDQLYQMVMDNYKPATTEEHIKVAESCREYELYDKSEYHFRLAEITSTPHRPESKIIQIIEDMRERYKDEKLKEYLYLIAKDIIDINYDNALKILGKTENLYSAPEFLEFYKSLRQEINYLTSKKLEQKVEDFYEAMIIYYLRTTATDRRKNFGSAIDFLTRNVQEEILKKMSSHLAIDERTIHNIWNKRLGKENKATYGSGSWIVEAPKLGNPEEWWERATNTERFNFLTAFFAEKYMKVINTTYKDCSDCGSSGKVFNANCSYCKGVGKIRIVHYK